MLELTTANVADYLRPRLGSGPIDVELLAGGVSNVVFRVTTPAGRFVLKQSRPQLRTRDAWFSDIDRIYREQEVMEALYPLLPEPTVPRVLFADRDNFVFAMSHAPDGSCVWKEALLAGQVEPAVGTRAGLVLGRMHEASAGVPSFAERFADRNVFVQLRVDPFYRTVQQRRPEVAAAVAPIIERLLTLKLALCHGDYTPKNILTHAQGFTLVDYETAHFGDPTMDIGLFLCHLILKAFRRPSERSAFYELTRAFWQGYAAEVRFQPVAQLQAHGIEHFAVCILARIDGTSPVDYLPAEAQREAVRQLGRKILQERPARWEEVLGAAERLAQNL